MRRRRLYEILTSHAIFGCRLPGEVVATCTLHLWKIDIPGKSRSAEIVIEQTNSVQVAQANKARCVHLKMLTIRETQKGCDKVFRWFTFYSTAFFCDGIIPHPIHWHTFHPLKVESGFRNYKSSTVMVYHFIFM